MLDYIDIAYSFGNAGDYQIRANLSNHSNPRCLTTGKINIANVLSTISYLSQNNNEMTFDGYYGSVTKVELDLTKKTVVLHVILRSNSKKQL